MKWDSRDFFVSFHLEASLYYSKVVMHMCPKVLEVKTKYTKAGLIEPQVRAKNGENELYSFLCTWIRNLHPIILAKTVFT